jgi:4-hydroxy-3-polyprenylbenzoate decarboxylase
VALANEQEQDMINKRIVVAISGASGAIYGIRLLEALRATGTVETHLVISDWAKKNIEYETDLKVDDINKLADFCYENKNLGAKISSGSFITSGMVIAPCSMKTLSAVANGYTENLIIRAADVALKEHRKLVLVPRETPLNAIHLENMLKLSRLGVTIAPPIRRFISSPSLLKIY